MEKSMVVPQETEKKNYHLIQQFCSRVYAPKNWKQNLEEMFVYSLFTVGKRWKQPRQSKWMDVNR